jgi:hypothetical protein
LLASVIVAAAGGVSAKAPRPAHVYDQIDASFEAEQAFDLRRRFLVDRQRWLNDEMVLWSRLFPGWAYYAEPWPFLPGDIYGYPLSAPPINQPIGRIEEQIGPNTWFSRPVHVESFGPPTLPEAEPAVERGGPREF